MSGAAAGSSAALDCAADEADGSALSECVLSEGVATSTAAASRMCFLDSAEKVGMLALEVSILWDVAFRLRPTLVPGRLVMDLSRPARVLLEPGNMGGMSWPPRTGLQPNDRLDDAANDDDRRSRASSASSASSVEVFDNCCLNGCCCCLRIGVRLLIRSLSMVSVPQPASKKVKLAARVAADVGRRNPSTDSGGN